MQLRFAVNWGLILAVNSKQPKWLLTAYSPPLQMTYLLISLLSYILLWFTVQRALLVQNIETNLQDTVN